MDYDGISTTMPYLLPILASSLFVQKFSDGIDVTLGNAKLRLTVYSPEVVRVRYVPAGGDLASKSLAVISKPTQTSWKLDQEANKVTLRTTRLRVEVARDSGAVTFRDVHGHVLLAETGARQLSPSKILSGALASRQAFALDKSEAIYGLGQHQNGSMNYRGERVVLQQKNTEIAVPMLVSSKGYGLLWDNPAVTTVDAGGGDEQVIDGKMLSDENGLAGGLTGHYFEGRNFEKPILTRKDPRIDFDWTQSPPPGLPHDNYSVRWNGFLTVPATGDYQLLSSGDDGIRLYLDDELVSQDWNSRPYVTLRAKRRLIAGRKYRVRFEFYQEGRDSQVRFAMESPGKSNGMVWSSEVADAVDYVFFYGPEIDQVIAGYRRLTGQVPMFGRWAWGLWQSKERYQSQSELLDVVGKYREAKIPLDGIIQDWQYWPSNQWGSHILEASRYPDPLALARTLHEEHVHSLISVWPKFAVSTATGKEMRAAGGMLPGEFGGEWWYDPFSEIGRRTYWSMISRDLASKGWDGWWLDASEAELSSNWGEFRSVPTAMGPGAKVYNAYPLMHTSAVYQGQRAENPSHRVIILTRSAYAGQQRNAAISWSGDIQATWDVLAKQIPAGINFSLSGIPYWNTDTGGFFNSQPVTSPDYQDLFSRWFQFSCFCPMLRIHGTGPSKEIWRWPAETRANLEKFDELRYRLLPYIYSTSWGVTSQGSTMMRGLVMDFRNDPQVYEIGDQYMFGPAIMACPVTKPKASTRLVYLPKSTNWIDFWTGASLRGGQTITADAVGKLPLFVRSGSILPYGPAVQSSADASDLIELRIYPGADGDYSFYEDAGDGYDYEHGAYSTIPFHWNDRTHTLIIGARKGSFPNMQEIRRFRIVLVDRNRGVGISTSPIENLTTYNGSPLSIKLK